jgi:ribosomal protein S18 acetylase RimI-like enzyme
VVINIRNELRPGDVEQIVTLHGTIYAQEYGFDATFARYVQGPLTDFARAMNPRDRMWIAEGEGQIVGCIAIIAVSATEAQLRWYLVDPSARGLGLGRRLLASAVEFSQEMGYRFIFLWTVSALTTAAHLYRTQGFTKVEERPGRQWGVDVVEEKYVLELAQ